MKTSSTKIPKDLVKIMMLYAALKDWDENRLMNVFEYILEIPFETINEALDELFP